MSEQFGDGVSRTLSALSRSFSNVVWQQGKPPLDSELNLVGQIGWEGLSDSIRSRTHSGFLTDPVNSDKDYSFFTDASNYFEIGSDGKLIAVVNGWVIPIQGSDLNTVSNAIKLGPPPSSGARTDLVFLEVWRVLLEASPSTANKPASNKVWKYGNTQYGGTDNPTDEMIDGAVGFETTRRVQVQHRIRTVSGIDIGVYPEGLGAPNVYGRGVSESPISTFTFSNMKGEGDVGLWRAGDGDSENGLGTVDGYVYAVPLCAVFRRNSSPYVAVSGSTPEHNGAITRTPSSLDATSSGMLTVATLTSTLSRSALGAVSITGLVGSGFDDADLLAGGNRFIEIGTGLGKEILEISAVSTVNGTVTIASRGRAGTEAKRHGSGTQIRLYNGRPDGLYSDQIVFEDILDLRHCVNFGSIDYQRLLEASVFDVLFNRARTTFKLSGNGSDSKGVRVEEVDVLGNTSRNHTALLDAPNGIREVWSDSAIYQSGLSLLLDPSTTGVDTDGFTTTSLNATVINNWTTAPDFYPTAFLYTDKSYRYGVSFTLRLGGQGGTTGARLGDNTLTANSKVRFVHPREMRGKTGGDTHPIKLRLFGGAWGADAVQTYPEGELHRANVYMSPTEKKNFTDGFMVFGDPFLTVTSITTADAETPATGDLASFVYVDAGGTSKMIYAVNMNTVFNETYGNTTLTNLKTSYGNPTFYNLLTSEGEDPNGENSEIYLVMRGDPDSTDGYKNNGVYKVIGAGSLTTLSEALKTAGTFSTDSWLYCEKINGDDSDFVDTGATNMTGSLHVQNLSSIDDTMTVVITDPTLSRDVNYSVLSVALQWPNGQGAFARSPDEVNQITVMSAGSEFLRNSAYLLDTDPTSLPLVSADVNLPIGNSISTMSALRLKGRDFYGDITTSSNVSEEASRETEVYTDLGSRSLVLRPYQRQVMMLESTAFVTSRDETNDNTGRAIPQTYSSGVTVDGGAYFISGASSCYSVPLCAMPKFGRQDIPYHIRTSDTDPFMPGLNHLFKDSTDNTSDVFSVIGGEDNGGTGGVFPCLFVTGTGSYGAIGPTLAGGQEGIRVRKTVISNVSEYSVDFPESINGIELPPFFGIARVYGVYEINDFTAHTGGAIRGAHESDRITPIADAPINLLRTDAKDFTVYIKRNGADADTGLEGSHTYILTENAIDMTKVPGYIDGDIFVDYEYVVECVVFGFARGFIDRNNLVLARNHDGQGNPLTVASAFYGISSEMSPNDTLTNVDMVFPSAVPYGKEVYVSYKRTVYQGDPYHTRDGSIAQYADIPVRRGQLSPSLSYTGSRIRAEREADGTSALLRPNPRRLEVLSSFSFYTTLGTGNISGMIYPSTLNDVGYARYGDRFNSARIPSVSGTEYAETALGAFTEGLREDSTSDSVSIIMLEEFSTYLRGLEANTAMLTVRLTDTLENITNTYRFDGSVYSDATDQEFFVNAKGWAKDISESGDGYTVSVAGGFNYCVLVVQPNIRGNTNGRYTATITWEKTDGTQYSGFNAMVYLKEGVHLSVPSKPTKTVALFRGGVTVPVNGGDGGVESNLMGLTGRLPLGLLVNDFDFLGESPTGSDGGTLSDITNSYNGMFGLYVPVSENGKPYTKVTGASGDLLEMCDGDYYTYNPYTLDDPSGTAKYRVSRGSALHGVGGEVPGAPLSWGGETLKGPLLKGGLLACRALLVRNFEETAYGSSTDKSAGDELQMVIITSARYADGAPELLVGGAISPSGYGEGLTAAERYRVKGRPLMKSNATEPESAIPAPLVKS